MLPTKAAGRAFPVLASGRPGSTEPFFGSNGQLNASNNKDLITQFGAMFQAVASGQITFNQDVNSNVEVANAPTLAERRSHFIDAYRDRTSSKWAEMGSSIGAVLYETVQREGFARRFLYRADLQQGNDPRINIRFENVTAIVASGPAAFSPQLVRQRYLTPPEFYIEANPRVEEKEITRGASDLLDDVFSKSQEQIMVQEDKLWKQMADATVGLANNLTILAGGLTPTNLATFRLQVAQWGLPTENLVMSPYGWSDIVGNASAWGNLFDPVTHYEIIQTGYIGRLLGMGITTDGFRDPLQQVLGPNDLYTISAPVNHGFYTDRGPVEAHPVDSYPQGVPSRGWFMFEVLSAGISNARSVAKAQRA
jgi:hypothetical protein